MKKLVAGSQWFGPFAELTDDGDHYSGDGCVFPKDVVGDACIENYDPDVDIRLPTPEQVDNQWAEVRAERNKRLAACDWTQLPDAPVDAAVWAVYRQELRDITNQLDPFNIVWPEQP